MDEYRLREMYVAIGFVPLRKAQQLVDVLAISCLLVWLAHVVFSQRVTCKI